MKQATELYPLGRSTIYNLIEKGLIKSATTRIDKNQRYGCRLINRASLEAFLEARATGGETPAS
ncbi:helix-turn-helix domain-containing protein [Verrucomicrobiales bacterium]|nr:helix-turn-helix domain-containing protein [bacterium]MDB4808626.1 helix-turn-helix domain-containing protein [Verrucomicrobiales bacterium]